MKITEIYKKYRINKGLQEHMVRVAAVGAMICDHSPISIDRTVTVSACLLHDMGNLLKVKFDEVVDDDFFEPEGEIFWKEIQMQMKQKYPDVGIATSDIVMQIGTNPEISAAVDEAAFRSMVKVAESGTLETKVVEYADMRVNPWQVVSFAERFADIRERYVPQVHTAAYIDELEVAAKQIETELFKNTSISPEDITDESTVDIQKELWDWDITTRN